MVDMFIGNDPTPASEVIASYLKTDQSPRPSIALHASSNGGANNAATLVTHLAEQGYPAPFTSVTMDCSPGKAEPHSAAAAMRLSMPKMLWGEAISTALIYMFVYMYKLYVESLGKQDRIAVIRDTLNDPVMMGKGIRRLYLYSKIDPLVDLEHVREHAEEARTKCGAVVEEEVFVKAPHCALVNEDAGRYWAAVEANASNRGEPLQNPVEQSES